MVQLRNNKEIFRHPKQCRNSYYVKKERFGIKISYPVLVGTRWEDEKDSKNFVEFAENENCNFSFLGQSGAAKYRFTGQGPVILVDNKSVFALVLTSAIRSRFVVNGTTYSFVKK